MNITDSLKELYVAFGGDADDVATVTNISEILNAITIQLGGNENAASILEAIQNIVPVVPSAQKAVEGFITGNMTAFSSNTMTSIPSYAFYGKKELRTIDVPNATYIAAHAFDGTRPTKLVFPSVTVVDMYGLAFDNSMYETGSLPLTTIDFHVLSEIESSALSLNLNESSFTTLIIRTNKIVSSWGSINLPAGCSIYVPDTLVDGYKAASGWSSYAAQIKPISELEE